MFHNCLQSRCWNVCVVNFDSPFQRNLHLHSQMHTGKYSEFLGHFSPTLGPPIGDPFVKVAQIIYVSRNQLHCTANLNLGLMCKKAKHCWALSTNFLFLFSRQFFQIIFCFLLNWHKNSNYCLAKLFHETELQGIYL